MLAFLKRIFRILEKAAEDFEVKCENCGYVHKGKGRVQVCEGCGGDVRPKH